MESLIAGYIQFSTAIPKLVFLQDEIWQWTMCALSNST